MARFPRLGVLRFILAWMMVASAAFALSLDEAKEKGLLGERPNGYLGAVRPPASPEVQALMLDINKKRKSKYEEIARRNNTQLQSVEALAGKTAIERTDSGNFIQLPSGKWIKK